MRRAHNHLHVRSSANENVVYGTQPWRAWSRSRLGQCRSDPTVRFIFYYGFLSFRTRTAILLGSSVLGLKTRGSVTNASIMLVSIVDCFLIIAPLGSWIRYLIASFLITAPVNYSRNARPNIFLTFCCLYSSSNTPYWVPCKGWVYERSMTTWFWFPNSKNPGRLPNIFKYQT